jgi:excisionase family DNA binding protein
MDVGKLLSVAEASARLGVSPLTTRSWIRQRRLPCVRLGRRVLLDPRDIERFIDDNRVEAVSFDRR